MPDVRLVLTADNTQYVNKIKEAQTATQKLHDTSENTSKRRLGLIEQEEIRIKSLTELRRKAYRTTDIETYNKLLTDSTKRLKDHEKAGLDANKNLEKSSDGMIDKIGKMALAYLTVRSAVVVLKETVLAFFTKSQEGIELLERKINGLKASVSVLQGEFIKLGKSIIGEGGNESIPWGTRIVQGLRLISTTANLIPGVSKYFDDLAKRMNDAGDAAEKYTLIAQELEDAERGMIVPRAEANLKIREARLLYADSTKSTSERINALKTALDLENKTAEEEIKHQQYIILNLRDINEEKRKAGTLTDADRKHLEEAIAREIELRTESVGRQIRATASLVNARKELEDTERKEAKLTLETKEKNLEAEDKMRKIYFDRWKKMVEDEAKQNSFQSDLKKLLGIKDKDLELQRNEEFYKEQKKMAKQGDLDDAKVRLDKKKLKEEAKLAALEGAQAGSDAAFESRKNRLQAEMEAELSNENLTEGEKLKIKKKYAKEQQKIDTAQALINGALAIAKTFAVLGPLGWIPAALIAVQTGIQVAVIKAQKFAKGGWTGEGTRRDETGERVAGLVHEREFVIRKGPAHRFREVLEAINKDDRKAIFNSFNRLNPEIFNTPVNNISVENTGPNKRLDRINSQLSQLNTTLKPSRSLEVIELGTQTIYRKGNTTRTVRR